MSGKERCWEQDPKEALQGGDGEERCAMWRLLSSAADQLKNPHREGSRPLPASLALRDNQRTQQGSHARLAT